MSLLLCSVLWFGHTTVLPHTDTEIVLLFTEEAGGMLEDGLMGDEEETKATPTAEDPVLGEFSRLGYFILSVLIVGLIAWLVGAAPTRKKKQES